MQHCFCRYKVNLQFQSYSGQDQWSTLEAGFRFNFIIRLLPDSARRLVKYIIFTTWHLGVQCFYQSGLYYNYSPLFNDLHSFIGNTDRNNRNWKVIQRSQICCCYLTTHSIQFIYSHMALDKWYLRTTQIVRETSHCCHILSYSFQLTTRDVLHAPSHRHDRTYHDMC